MLRVNGRRRRHRVARNALLISLLGGIAALGPAAPVSSASAPAPAGVDGCALTAKKPGASGVQGWGKFSFFCIVGNLPFQYQVGLWEKDNGPDSKLSQTGWLNATLDSSGNYSGRGPNTACNTEGGTEELYTKVRARVGSPGNYQTTPWETSPLLTTKTCQ